MDDGSDCVCCTQTGEKSDQLEKAKRIARQKQNDFRVSEYFMVHLIVMEQYYYC